MKARYTIVWNGLYSNASKAHLLRYAAIRLHRHYKIRRLEEQDISMLDLRCELFCFSSGVF
jgi:hypothetical protein